MVGVIVVTHGPLAETLVQAAVRLAGPLRKVRAVSVDATDTPDQIAERIGWEAEQLDAGQGVLFLVDLLGSTPFNVCLAEARRRSGDVLSGVNLPMLIKLETAGRESTASALGAELRGSAMRCIRLGSEVTPTGTPRP